MRACLENTSLPLEEARLPLLESAPTWTIRITRPAAANRNELSGELRGVPKSALRHIFGKAMGTRLWQHHRAVQPAVANSTAQNSTSAKGTPEAAISTLAPVADAEISSGMLRYLCAEAAATLQGRKRLAKSISLTVLYSNGDSETAHQLLLQSTNDPKSLEAAAQAAIRGMSCDSFVSCKLNLTA